MQTAAIDAPALSVSMNKGKLIIRGPALARHSEFLQTLPSSRWNELLGAWTCEATPSAAWRLACLEGSRGCQHTTFLSAQFAAAIASSDSDSQPPLRRFDAWQHQRKGYHFAAPKPAALLAMGMGTGKSKLATDLICNDSDAKSVLILCPSSVLGVWRRELETHAGRPIESLILDKGTTKKKAEVADDFLIRHAAWGKRSIAAVVANYESAWREVLAKWQLSRGWDWVICDESHRIKSHDSASSKHCAALGKVSARRLCLTGTPLPHSPLDAFGQFRFLDRGIFGTWFTHFRSRYARMSPIFPGQVDEWQNQEELTERMGLLTYRCKAEDVLDLPPVTHHSREVELGSDRKSVV